MIRAVPQGANSGGTADVHEGTSDGMAWESLGQGSVLANATPSAVSQLDDQLVVAVVAGRNDQHDGDSGQRHRHHRHCRHGRRHQKLRTTGPW